MSIVPGGLPQRVSYGIVYKNTNANWIAEGITVDVRFQDAAGKEVGSDTFTTTMVAPGADAAAGHTVKIEGAAKFSATIKVDNWRKTDKTYPAFSTTDVVFDRTSINGTPARARISGPGLG